MRRKEAVCDPRPYLISSTHQFRQLCQGEEARRHSLTPTAAHANMRTSEISNEELAWTLKRY